jgi:DNA-binding MarR family transcriptional regulator
MDKPLLHPLLCVNNNLHKTARTVARIYTEELLTLDIKRAQFSILTALSLMGEASITELAIQLEMDRSTASRTLKPLQQRGLIATTVSERDGRAKMLTLTPAGQALHRKALPLWQRAQKRIIKAFGAKDWLSLNANLESLREAARRA